MYYVLFLVIVLFFKDANAAMAPRMRSFMTQFSGTANSLVTDSPSEHFHVNGSLDFIYLVRTGPSFGLRYFAETRNETGNIEGGQSYGAILGYYHHSGMFILGTYDLSAKLGDWSKGSGYQADLGYMDHIGGQMHIGLKLSHRSTKYTEDHRDRTATDRTVSDSFPSLVFMRLF